MYLILKLLDSWIYHVCILQKNAHSERDSPERVNMGRKWCQWIGIPSMISRWIFFKFLFRPQVLNSIKLFSVFLEIVLETVWKILNATLAVLYTKKYRLNYIYHLGRRNGINQFSSSTATVVMCRFFVHHEQFAS